MKLKFNNNIKTGSTLPSEEEVRPLLEKYFDGESSLNEENSLRRFFTCTPLNEVPEDLRSYVSLFEYFEEERGKSEGRVEIKQRLPKRRVWFLTAGAAAAILLGIVLTINYRPEPQEQGIRLVISGVQVNNDSLALSIARDKFKILRKGLLRAENSLKPMGKLEGTFKKINKLTSNIIIKEDEE